MRGWKLRLLYLPNHVYEEWLPLAALVLLAIHNLQYLWLLLLHLVFFYQPLLKYSAVLTHLVFAAYYKSTGAAKAVINYSIYYLFLVFGADLKKQNISAFTYLKRKLGFRP
jgi:hypothetical protein